VGISPRGQKGFDEVKRPTSPVSSFRVYPNPTPDHAVLQWNWLEEGLNDALVYSIRNLQGQLLKTVSITDFKRNTMVIDFSGLPTGYYILDVSSKNGQMLFKDKVSVIK